MHHIGFSPQRPPVSCGQQVADRHGESAFDRTQIGVIGGVRRLYRPDRPAQAAFSVWAAMATRSRPGPWLGARPVRQIAANGRVRK